MPDIREVEFSWRWTSKLHDPSLALGQAIALVTAAMDRAIADLGMSGYRKVGEDYIIFEGQDGRNGEVRFKLRFERNGETPETGREMVPEGSGYDDPRILLTAPGGTRIGYTADIPGSREYFQNQTIPAGPLGGTPAILPGTRSGPLVFEDHFSGPVDAASSKADRTG